MGLNQAAVILWAVDPFSGEWKAQRRAASAIAALTSGRSCRVQPVYLATNPLSNLPQGFASEVFEGVREKGQDRLNEMMGGLAIESLAPLKIIQVNHLSITEQVTTLLTYARELHPELIVVGTRARTGMPRWFFGSFAEELTLRSDIPLLVVNPSWEPSPSVFRNIVFPTDFSEASREVYREIQRFARPIGASIHIFHKYYRIAAPIWDSPIEVKISYPEVYQDGLKEVRREAEKWVSEAAEQDVRATFEIDTGPGDSILDSILERTQHENCLIAMAAQSTPLQVRLMGSVTRKVIREASAPVWVLHPREKRVEADKNQQAVVLL